MRQVARHCGGEQVTDGMYWNLQSGAFFQTPSGGAALPGTPSQQYLRMPGLLVMTTSPLLGLAFVFFLPLVGIVGFAGFSMLCLIRFCRWGVLGSARAAFPRARREPPPGAQQQSRERPAEDVNAWLQNLTRKMRK